MTCDFTPITPLIGGLFQGGVVRIGASSTFPVRGGQIGGLPVGNELPDSSASGVPTNCTVPSFSGTKKNNAQTTWTIANFLTQVQFLDGNGNYIIGSQTIAGGTPNEACDAVITVGP